MVDVPLGRDAGATGLDATLVDTGDERAAMDRPVDLDAGADVWTAPLDMGPERPVFDAMPSDGALTDADATPGTWPDGTLPPSRFRRYRVYTTSYSDRNGTPMRTPSLPDGTWPLDGGSLPYRTMNGNGILTLAPDHTSFAFGTTISPDFNFFPAIPPANGFFMAGHFGYTIPPTIARFEPGPLGFYYFDAPNDGGTFSVAPGGFANRGHVELTSRNLRIYVDLLSEEDNQVPYRRAVSLRSIIWQRGRIGRLRAPHAVLRWDLLGAGRFALTHDIALRFGGEPLSSFFPVEIGGAPDATLRGTVGGVEVAAGYVLLYDDLNGDGRFNESEDTILAQSPIGLAWRGPGVMTAELARSPFSDLIEGWETVRFQQDEARGGWCLAPFDNRDQPTLDAVVEENFSTLGIELY